MILPTTIIIPSLQGWRQWINIQSGSVTSPACQNRDMTLVWRIPLELITGQITNSERVIIHVYINIEIIISLSSMISRVLVRSKLIGSPFLSFVLFSIVLSFIRSVFHSFSLSFLLSFIRFLFHSFSLSFILSFISSLFHSFILLPTDSMNAVHIQVIESVPNGSRFLFFRQMATPDVV